MKYNIDFMRCVREIY